MLGTGLGWPVASERVVGGVMYLLHTLPPLNRPPR